MPPFTCTDCGTGFSLPQVTLDRFPGWTPRQCLDCRKTSSGASRAASGGAAPRGRGRTSAPRRGPAPSAPSDTGVFTDGACSGNPGPGGWGAVRVEDGHIVAERHGGEPSTTNNRMELTALIEGLLLVEPHESIDAYSDSVYVVNIVNDWGAKWEANGWRRGKTARDEILNLDLVQRLMQLVRARPHVTVRWVRGHAGDRWNEHADALARRYQESH